MKVMLLQDVKDQGRKGDMITVSDGYARNYLLPRKLAAEATADIINNYNMKQKSIAEREAREKKKAGELAERLAGSSVTVTARAGSEGRLFGSVTSKEIADAVKEQLSMEMDKHQLVLDEPVRALGEYKVKVKLGYEVSASLTVKVVKSE